MFSFISYNLVSLYISLNLLCFSTILYVRHFPFFLSCHQCKSIFLIYLHVFCLHCGDVQRQIKIGIVQSYRIIAVLRSLQPFVFPNHLPPLLSLSLLCSVFIFYIVSLKYFCLTNLVYYSNFQKPL